MEKMQFLQQIMLEKLESYMQKKKKKKLEHSLNTIYSLLNTIHKNKLEMEQSPKYKTRFIKLLEENIGRTL